ncbi:glycine zipper 2TM domain-containing protein [Candidatus Thioglobus sp.]|uniref:glycine zipper 2TM domain-containing protein n=1 Tax=Candidatus Thioglobus sp. TaxID=2026721 RepID=UPI003D14E331
MFKSIITIASILLLTSCSSLDRFTQEDQDSKSYSSSESGQFSRVTEGVIVSIKEVKISGTKGLGTTFGTVLGGLAGSATTDRKYNKEAAIAIGALAGALLGSTVEKFSTEGVAYEFLIKTSSGLKAFVDTTKQDLKSGDAVYIIHGSGPVRISKR